MVIYLTVLIRTVLQYGRSFVMIQQMEKTAVNQANRSTKLRQQISQHFDDEELRTLCVDVGADYDDLGGRGKSDKVRELVAWAERHGKWDVLVAAVHAARPHLAATDSQPPPHPAPPTPSPNHNPFFFGGRITHSDHFFGRQRLLRELRQELQKRSNVSLVGESQIGKSSLLYHLYQSRAAWLPRSTVAYIDLQGVLDEADFCEMVLAALGQPGDSLRQLKRVLSGQDVVLLFDEMERLADSDFNPRLHHLLRSLSQESRLAFCVASQQPLEIVFAPPPGQKLSPFHNVFVSQRLGPFSDNEARELLLTRLRPFPNLFSPAEIEQLLAQSGGHPARLQRVAHQLFREKTT